MNGWLLLDKPQGWTSTHVGTWVKKNCGVKKVGHVGTLDPMATGVLILALNEATKLIPYLNEGAACAEGQAEGGTSENSPPFFPPPRQKTYEFDVCFGKTTDTLDSEGAITEESRAPLPSKKQLLEACEPMVGPQEQIPPLYSALKKGGRRACDLARQGVPVTLAPRRIWIHSLKLVDFPENAETARFCATVSPGTYVRALARDLAFRVGTLGFVTHLRRLQDGNVTARAIISLEKLENLAHNLKWLEVLVPMEALLGDIPDVFVSERERKDLLLGRPVAAGGVQDSSAVKIFFHKQLIAMGAVRGGVCFPKRVLCF
ncbi:tRNA pseudouridine synthase B [Alphaproteobacteria bacterium]|nr:tRNA pseudouridine synthase B [Alphaproteobacteria bacterium]GHS99574.1 tRNA pseudouridine synthase B [Alphaproteobacteria bacterium]